MKTITNNELIANAMLMRSELLKKLLDPRRDIDEECGYPRNPSISDYKLLYDREGVGARVVDIFPEESWKTPPEVLEAEGGEHTDWEEQWIKLEAKHSIYSTLARVDALSGIGKFGIVLLGIDDGKGLHEPVEGINPVTGEAIQKSKTPTRQLLYLRTFDQSVVKISRYETDKNSPRYAQPAAYQINLSDEDNSDGASSPDVSAVDVHWTRVIHVADNCKNSHVFGEERMKNVLNYVCNVRKILGGSGEMFWKGGFPGIALESTPSTEGAVMTEDDKKKLRAEMDKYQNKMQRYIALIGMTAKSLAPQIADPTANFETQVKAICITKGIPYRIFMGSEAAQLASEQDSKAWNSRMNKRRKDYITPRIIRPFVDRLMAIGVVGYLEEYVVAWDDLNTPTQEQLAKVAELRTKALAAYISGTVDSMILPLDFLTHVMGYSTEIAQSILENANLETDGTVARPERTEQAEAARVAGAQANAKAAKKQDTRNAWSDPKKKKRHKMVNGGAY